MKALKNFAHAETGAVTVDWVVLTAGVVVLSVAVATTMTDPINTELVEIATVVTDTN